MKRILLSLILVISAAMSAIAEDTYSSCIAAAKDGDKVAQAKIGYFYYTGTGGVFQDYDAAYRWFKSAALQDNYYAQYYVGMCYKEGHGVAKDPAQAFFWFRKAAKENYLYAKYEMAHAFEYGEGVAQNLDSAALYYYRPAQSKILDAAYRLGRINYNKYNNDGSIVKNSYLITFFLIPALDEMDPQTDADKIADTRAMLGDLFFQMGNEYYNNTKDPSQRGSARSRYRDGIRYGSYESEYGYGNCFFYGVGVEKDLPKAITHYTIAAENGVKEAQYALGMCYKNGTGVPLDENTAHQWLLRAAQNGHVDACYETGQKREEQSLLDEAAEWYLKIIATGDETQKDKAEKRLEFLDSMNIKAAIDYINSATVEITGYFKNESIYILDPATKEYTFCGKGKWETTNYPVGTYTVKRTCEAWEDKYETIVIAHPHTTISFDKMDPKLGTLSVQSKPDKADVYVNNEFMGKTPWVRKAQMGEYRIQVKKDGWLPSQVYKAKVPYQKNVTTSVKLKSEAVYGDDWHPDHYLEPTYGLDLTQLNNLKHYVGLRYGWIPKRFGLEVATLYGISNQELSATIGPSFRLTKFSSPLSLQFNFGAGAMHRFTDNYTTWALDAGLRFGFEDRVNSYDFAWWSFTLGTRYYDKRFIPTVSVSLMPVRALTMLAKIEEDFPCFFTEIQTGYEFGSKQWMLGAHLDYISSHLGVGTSFMVGFNGGWDVTAGPVFRLTPDDLVLDLQVYQGFGYGSWGYNQGFMGESGIRFAFDQEFPYWGLWSFNIGCIYDGKGTVAATIGFSLPIVSIIGTAGIAAPFYFMY